MSANTDDGLRPGDRVYVDDPGLAALRDVMRRHTGAEPAPNHHGTVESVEPAEDGFSEEAMVYIVFDGPEGEATSNCAPYPLSERASPRPARWTGSAQAGIKGP